MDGPAQSRVAGDQELARLADDMKFEAIVPVGRWKGFGGETNFNGEGFEVFAWAAGLSRATTYSSVFATSHIPTVHPLFAAKQAAAIDHIGDGRFTLNLVTGWYSCRRWTCSASRSSITTAATTWPRNGCRSPRGCGPIRSRSIFPAASIR